MPPSVSARSASAHNSKVNGQERRLVALDGLRGLMTIMVVLSHYFGELPNGLQPMMFSWVAVSMFFVMSGFLIGRLILDKKDSANFFVVFYFRRFCRLVPVYLIVVIVVSALLTFIAAPWADPQTQFPFWSYVTFTQNFFMAEAQSVGAHWLAPTWTLAVEEHFYLIVPALLVFTPRALLAPVLVLVSVAAVALRGAIYFGGAASEMSALVLLPTRADVLACGLLAALALRNKSIDWRRFDLTLRIAPMVALIVAGALNLYSVALFNVFGPLVVAIGCTSLVLAIVRGAPEAKRFHSKTLRFFGDNSYCIYLTHVAVLGLAHGLILNGHPDIATLAQWAVTLGALPVAVLIGWALTQCVEVPFMRLGRKMQWSAESRGRAMHAGYAPA